jgi:hypothetical protein
MKLPYSIVFAITFGVMLCALTVFGYQVLAPTQQTATPVDSQVAAALPTPTASPPPSPTPLPSPTSEPTALPAPEKSAALLVIQFSPTERYVRQVEFTTPISGLLALQNSGIEPGIGQFDFGKAVCSIGEVGCPLDNCFCSDKFWGNLYWDGTAWQPYMVGPVDTRLEDGAIDAWQWGAGDPAAVPPARALLAAYRGLEWLDTQQVITSGGYGSPSTSLEALLTIASNGQPATDWRANESAPSLADYWQVNALEYASQGLPQASKLVSGLATANLPIPDEVQQALSNVDLASGAFSEHSGFQAWAMLATLSMSQTLPASSLETLKSQAQADGGWEWNVGFGSDSNTTALVLQTLVAAGEPVSATLVTDGLNYLKTLQNPDGGFAYTAGGDSDANSTAYAVQAIRAAGQDPSAPKWVIDGNAPLDYLLGLQLPEGAFEWQAGMGADLYATLQVIPALLGRALPY